MNPLVPGAPLPGAPLPPPVGAVPPVPPGLGGTGEVRAPWERRQPQVRRRSVVPVEWFRRTPGGGTTYAPEGAAPTPDGQG